MEKPGRACIVGGSGVWAYSAWTPTCGVGPTTQTRTGTCAAKASSGLQSRSVNCARSDGATVDASNCTGAAPVTNQPCTPASGFSCGTEGALAQKVTLTTACH